MARINNLTNFLTDVATSIKAKTGDSSLIPASQFDTKIAGITTGKLSNEEYTKANNDLDNILYESENVLPDTYQQVEYIQLSGEQYIDTNYALWTNTNWKLEYKFDVNEFYNYNNMIGSLETSNSYNEIWITSDGNYYIRFTDVSRTSLGILELNTPYTIIHDNTGTNLLNYVNGELVQTSNKANTSLNYKLGLGHREGAKFLKGKIYYAKFWNGNELVRNFVPCYRKSDNEAGMYDTVNNVFYTNEGNGEFIVGVTENALPNEYQEVEYLISDGYEYIDTGYAFTNPELKLEVKYRKTSTLGRNVFGVDLSQSPRKMHGNVFKNALYIGNSVVINDVPQELGVDYTLKFEFKNNVAKWNINGNEYTYNGANGWQGALDTETEYLFANRGAKTAQYLLIGRIYYAKFYDNNGDLVRNFIPCYRKADNKPGMYDTVNNVFYTNEGTGDFVVGADVDILNTKIESILTEKIMKIKPENIKSGVEILGVVGTYTGN